MQISQKEKIIKIKQLREKSKASIKECEDALKKGGYDIEQSLFHLQSRMLKFQEKKKDHKANSGFIGHYSHCNGKFLGIVELLSETDFVSKNKDFQELANDLAAQVIFSSDVKYTDDEEFFFYEGDVSTSLASTVLFRQPYFRDESILIKNLISEYSAKFGEKLEIKNWNRYRLI